MATKPYKRKIGKIARRNSKDELKGLEELRWDIWRLERNLSYSMLFDTSLRDNLADLRSVVGEKRLAKRTNPLREELARLVPTLREYAEALDAATAPPAPPVNAAAWADQQLARLRLRPTRHVDRVRGGDEVDQRAGAHRSHLITGWRPAKDEGKTLFFFWGIEAQTLAPVEWTTRDAIHSLPIYPSSGW